MKPLVTIVEPQGPLSWFEPLNDCAHIELHVPQGPMTPAVVSDILKRSDGVIITSATAISADQIEEAKNLGIIAKCGGPPSNVDMAYATQKGVAVSCCPGANTTSIAEYAVMEIIAMLHRFDEHFIAVEQGKWRTPTTLLGHDLRDATIGLVGLGAIGSEVLRKLQPFDCNVLIYSPHASKEQALPPRCTFADSLEDMLPQCDVVTVHCKVTEETKGMFDRKLFGLMKPGAIFINTARGALVDESALAEALMSGHLSSAAVDVFDVEPLPADNPLRQCKNAILTPHSSGWTEEALWRECNGAARSAAAFFKGQTIPGLLNPDYVNHRR